MNFQNVILTLQNYWAAQGCAIVQPVDLECGAGTFNPSTFLRVLGPEPWKAAYVEPSRRPTDGRYGDNPNRLQHYFQFQVILKPSPENVQDLYLGSLRALGLDPARHDIRFVEDDWESPTLGAWGLGWEVWLNGMEVSQFTYFQQVGGIELAPISVELTYGLERLTMYLRAESRFMILPGTTASVTAMSIIRMRWSSRATISTRATRACCLPTSTTLKRNAAVSSSLGFLCLPTITV